MDKSKEVYVFYVSVDGLDAHEQEEYIYKQSKRIYDENKSIGENSIFIPILGETRVECINPVYITDTELIKKNERLLSELNEHLGNQLNQIKEQ